MIKSLPRSEKSSCNSGSPQTCDFLLESFAPRRTPSKSHTHTIEYDEIIDAHTSSSSYRSLLSSSASYLFSQLSIIEFHCSKKQAVANLPLLHFSRPHSNLPLLQEASGPPILFQGQTRFFYLLIQKACPSHNFFQGSGIIDASESSSG